MKWHSLSFIAILFSNFVFAQDNLKDSLLAQLEKASNDSNHIALLNQLSSQYIHSRPDSSIYYSRQAISLAKSTNDELGVIRGLRSISFAYAITGNFSEGLENGLDALKKSELNGDPELIAASLSTIGGVYSEQNDHQGAMIYGLQALKALEKVPESPRHLSLQINIGYGYIELNKLDSALLHLNHALELSLRNNNKLMTALVYMNLAMVNLKLKQYKQVEMYCGLCIPIFIKENNLAF